MDKNELFEHYISTQMSYTNKNRRSLQGKQRRFGVNFVTHMPSIKDAKILDFGPGFGELMLLLRDLGYTNISGIDVSPEVVSFCNGVMPNSTDLVADPISFFLAHEATYDVVCASHVLEHIPKDKIILLLQAVRYALKPEGCLIAEVPNGDAVLGGIMRYGDFTHELSYSERSLLQIMSISGFSEVKVRAAQLPLDHPLRLFQIMAQRMIFLLTKLMCRILDIYTPNYLNASIVCVSKK